MLPPPSAVTDSLDMDGTLKDYKVCQALLEKLNAMHAQVIKDNAALRFENAKLHSVFNDRGLPANFLDAPDSQPAQVLPFAMPNGSVSSCANHKSIVCESWVEKDATKCDQPTNQNSVFLSLSPLLPVVDGDSTPNFTLSMFPEEHVAQNDQTNIDDLVRQVSVRTMSSEDVVDRWQKIVYMLFNPKANPSSSFLEEDVQCVPEFHHVWLISTQISTTRVGDNDTTKPPQLQHGTSLHGQYLTSNSPLQRIIMDPAGHKPLLWGAIGACILLYDLVVTPLSFFLLTSHVLQLISSINKVTLAYWILDVFVQLGTGFPANGVIDMRPPRIFIQYIKTWFLADMLIIFTDVALLYVTQYVGGASSLRMVRILRLVRLCRFLRIRRLKSMASLFESMSVQINSAFIQLVLSLMQHVFVIILINHYIACAWYYVSWASMHHFGYDTSWLRKFGVELATVERQYVLAFHWSLTQFSPATNNVSPENTSERTFSCAVVVFAMIVFSSFISNVTSTVNQLNQLNSKKLQEEKLIRTFLSERSISTELGSQIIRFFNLNFYRNNTRVQRSDIKIMAELPERLIRRLDDEMYAIIILSSRMIGKLVECDRLLASKLCSDCTSMHNYMAHQDVFAEEVECVCVYYMSDGVSTYLAARSRSTGRPSVFQAPQTTPDAVNVGDWMSEMAFWVPWHHQGRLNCSTASEFLCMQCAKFATCVSSHGGKVYHMMCVLAIYLVAHIDKGLDEGEVLTDLSVEKNEMDKITSHALKFCSNFRMNSIRTSFSPDLVAGQRGNRSTVYQASRS